MAPVSRLAGLCRLRVHERAVAGPSQAPFWTEEPAALFARLGSSVDGLSAVTADSRLHEIGLNRDAPVARLGAVAAVVRRLLEPLCLMLIVAGLVAISTSDTIGGSIILLILVVSIGLDTWQESRATKAVELLRRSVALKAEALRDRSYVRIDVEQVVPGDIVRIRAGDIVPADALLLQADALTTGEAALTGEPYPVEKQVRAVASHDAADAVNAVFRGSVVQTGEGIALVVNTGVRSLFGTAAAAVADAQAPSPFQRDLHAFGLLTARLTIALIVVVLVAHVMFGRAVLQSLMFSAALAVGLTPELLPMITTVTLARGALRMAARKVIVKRLASIHDLGAMTVLCTDKTGTLTSADIVLAETVDSQGRPCTQPAVLAAVAAILGGDRSVLDAALVASHADSAQGWTLLRRRAFDYQRRTGALLAQGATGRLLIVKGAPEAVLTKCSRVATDGTTAPMEQGVVLDEARRLAERGLRAIAVASKPWPGAARDLEEADEDDLTFEGFCCFADPPKPTAATAVARLAAAGVRIKILSGDHPIVVRRVAEAVGIGCPETLSGAEIAVLGEDALAVRMTTADVLARLTPDQKARVVHALQSKGEIVGFLGDGINDAPALKKADVGLSVEGASGVAQAAADMILLASDLEVVADGVEEGRRTFANILKYVRMGASSNFGNMLSMAAASLFLPFLPMLPVQILLNNLLYDFSEIGIPFDTVSKEATARPQVWNMRDLVRFAVVMGPLSSAFDFMTFGVIVLFFHAPAAEFQTLWFMESMATQILVVFVIRSTGRPWASAPHPVLVATSLTSLAIAVAVPFLPLGNVVGFATPETSALMAIGGLVVAYLLCAEFLKKWAVARTVGRA